MTDGSAPSYIRRPRTSTSQRPEYQLAPPAAAAQADDSVATAREGKRTKRILSETSRQVRPSPRVRGPRTAQTGPA